jgi:hypothetical protein
MSPTVQLVVLGMSADPEPYQPIISLDCESTIVTSCSHRPKAADLLKVERRMAGIALETFEGLIGDFTNVLR